MKFGRLGIQRGVPIEEYHADASAISNTGLNDFRRSPAHFSALHLDPRRPPRDPSTSEKSSRLAGHLAHCAILEPDEFDRRYAVGPNINRNTAKWKEFEALASADGRVAIKQHQSDTAWAQAGSVRAYPDVLALLGDGEAEVSVWWHDPTTGVRCRCRPDWVHTIEGQGAILLDVKTCGNASEAEFARQVRRMGYHRQATLYSDGYAIASGMPVLGFVFVAVEDEWPHAAAAYMLDDESLDVGRRQVRTMLDRYAGCMRTNTWPSYSTTVELVRLSNWGLSEE